ncbi:sce7726 family protein [Aquibium pacificus]|uniref:sce7726 family protein n=1 Tax=Aquibium pacificus TaxID=3153579 RepID=UPI00349FA135
MRDKDVRAAVMRHLLILHCDDPSTRIVEEMGLWSGSVRVDVAVINGELSGIEIKSDRDTLDRLPLQERTYSRIFDQVTLVVGTKHVDRAYDMIPKWWGVTTARFVHDHVELTPCRPAQRNPAPDPILVAGLLWKEEALSALEERGLARGVRSKPVSAVHERLATELPFHELSACVRERLKRRSAWLGQAVSH